MDTNDQVAGGMTACSLVLEDEGQRQERNIQKYFCDARKKTVSAVKGLSQKIRNSGEITS